jgi:hypothetical protein
LTTPCSTILSTSIHSPDPISIGLELPAGVRMMHWTLNVSRTFRPSDFGGDDRRELGATVSSEFTDSADRFRSQEQKVLVKNCDTL